MKFASFFCEVQGKHGPPLPPAVPTTADRPVHASPFLSQLPAPLFPLPGSPAQVFVSAWGKPREDLHLP